VKELKKSATFLEKYSTFCEGNKKNATFLEKYSTFCDGN
tara:strand:- start:765 stop:881 length:117 start_codon:yes stop_codon:yes gene_type:complete